MHIEEWSAPRVAAVLASLRKDGISESRLARMAGVNRSQVNRWGRGENRPGYDAARRLASYLRREHPDLADELLAAAGYGPPGSEPEPEPELPPSLIADINRTFPDEEGRQRAVRLLQRALSGETAVPASADGEPPEHGRRAG